MKGIYRSKYFSEPTLNLYIPILISFLSKEEFKDLMRRYLEAKKLRYESYTKNKKQSVSEKEARK